MSQDSRLVALKEYKRKSSIPQVVAVLSLGASIVIMIMALLTVGMVLLFNFIIPQVQNVQQVVIQQQEDDLRDLQGQLDTAVTEQEKQELTEAIEQAQAELDELKSQDQPGSLDEIAQAAGVKGFMPFMMISNGTLMILGFFLFLVSIAVFFRYRWSRRAYLVLCILFFIWLVVDPVLSMTHYNKVLANPIFYGGGQMGMGGSVETGEAMQGMISEMQLRNFQFMNLAIMILGIGFFAVMYFCMTRPIVKEDFQPILGRDEMDWDTMPEGGRIEGEEK